ncbi:hypothetical protein DL96DRAFT_350050 [Flagelloscypha sp. PMI_526]|nr:hypothetical protein DL96DRAFT_350050 [Flagelloscypha sp. PMI_526]
MCDIAYHTIFLCKTSMYNVFASLIASKPPNFFACRTRALYVPQPPYDQSRSALWPQLWAKIVSKLPSIHYLEVFGDYSQSFEMRSIALRTIETIEGLAFLTLDRALVSFLIDLICQNCAPVFLHLTHLKLLSSVKVEERSKLLLRSKSFPGVSHPCLWLIHTLRGAYLNPSSR